MKKCPYCGRENADAATVCEHCRAAVVTHHKQEQPVADLSTGLKKKQRSEKYGS